MSKSKLVLLGVWNQLPFSVRPWHCDIAKKHFCGLTNRYIRSFVSIKDELSYQCFLARDLELLKSDFERLNDKEQVRYVKAIVRDYYRQAKPFEKCLAKYKKAAFKNFTDTELAGAVGEMSRLLPPLAMSAWYAVIMDIWYPSAGEYSFIKKILARSRDHLGRLHVSSARIDDALLKEVGWRLRTNVPGMYYLFPEEITSALAKKQVPEPLLEKRIQFCVTTDALGPYRIFEGAAAKKIAQKYDLPKQGHKKQSVLRGTPANVGIVTGRVRKVVLDSDFSKFKQGEILVALQTMAHYVSIMKKAKAILTEFGGLTSHAAIVGRELGKPCVVGIPNLVVSLKDGDRVEVDATRGVVRKL